VHKAWALSLTWFPLLLVCITLSWCQTYDQTRHESAALCRHTQRRCSADLLGISSGRCLLFRRGEDDLTVSFFGGLLIASSAVGLLITLLHFMTFRVMFCVLKNVEQVTGSLSISLIVVELTLAVIHSMPESWLQRRDTR